MSATFHGLQTALKGLNAQQAALRTAGHNIANANTQGYSRQRVNFEATEAYPAPGRNAPSLPGQIGTGVTPDSIQRVRENFLDLQYRGENTEFGYVEATLKALERMEEMMNEPSDIGLGAHMDRFWEALQDLSVNPEDTSAREVARQRAVSLADTYNYLTDSLKRIQREFQHEINTSVDVVNGLLADINAYNEEINRIELRGNVPNDLYDQRDRIIDELSGYIDIEVEEVSSAGNAAVAAEGMVNIHLLDSQGNRLNEEEMPIVNARTNEIQELAVVYSEDSGAVEQIGFQDLPLTEVNGKIKGFVEAFGYEENGEVTGIYPDQLETLAEMFAVFVDTFNETHDNGWNLKEIASEERAEERVAFFEFDEDGALFVNLAIMNDLELIAAASAPNNGDGTNALELANIKSRDDLEFPGGTTSIEDFYQSIIGKLAVETGDVRRNSYTSEVRKNTIDENRQSVSGVSLDEEMVNMIQFQHAYNAASRTITVIDEMLDRIINQMGIVGR